MPTTVRTNEQRWNAIARRDALADGEFVFAVRTTGVYCRPSCKARLPRRENVMFFTDSAAARQAGFRACKRCRPDEVAADATRHELIAVACQQLESTESAPSLSALAATAGLSAPHFQRVFKRIVGVSPKQFAIAVRTRRLRAELREQRSVTRAVQAAGFNSTGRVYDGVFGRLGMTPSVFRMAARVAEFVRP